MRAVAVALGAAASLGAASEARAQAAAGAPAVPAGQGAPLRDLAQRVIDEWRKAGAVVDRGPPRFLYDDETMTVALPPSTGTSDQACTTVALLGSRGVSFHAKIAGSDDDPLNEDAASSRAASVAGVLEMGGCGAGATPLEHLLVTSDAGRGAIETVVARSPTPLPVLKTVLPERTGGVLPPSPDAGSPPALPPPGRRAEVAEARSRRDGAIAEARVTWTAGTDGSGDAKVTLEAGCHKIEIFAPDARQHASGAPRRRRLDVDAELRDEDDELLTRDRSDAADAHLEACVGEATKATVVFAGAPPGLEVIATHMRWPLPDRLPMVWDAEARGRMARALHVRHADAPVSDPIALFAGPSGITPIAVALEPGACYLAVAATTHGHARGLGLRAIVEARDARDERTPDDDGGAVAFCAHDARRARLEVEARGTSLSWGLALYRVSSRGKGTR